MQEPHFEVWVSSSRIARFQDRYVFTRIRFLRGADLTASGRPLKTDKQIAPPLMNAAPRWDGY
jgi:hypothetical protein